MVKDILKSLVISLFVTAIGFVTLVAIGGRDTVEDKVDNVKTVILPIQTKIQGPTKEQIREFHQQFQERAESNQVENQETLEEANIVTDIGTEQGTQAQKGELGPIEEVNTDPITVPLEDDDDDDDDDGTGIDDNTDDEESITGSTGAETENDDSYYDDEVARDEDTGYAYA